MKLERMRAAAQTEFPKVNPLKRNHSVSNISAPIPEKKRIPQKTAPRALACRFGDRSIRVSVGVWLPNLSEWN